MTAAPAFAAPPARGRFITFEGGEGTGKSTQAHLLAAHLRARGLAVVESREPGGSPGAEAVRHILLSGAAEPFGAEAEALLFAAARADHVGQLIRPALTVGRWVVCDRFFDSTRVYQGAAGKVDDRLLDALEAVAAADARPDLTVVLDVPAELGLARAAARGAGVDRFEKEDRAYHERVRAAFLALAAGAPERCVVVDAARAKEEVAAEIARIVDERLLNESLSPQQGTGA